MQLLTVTSCRNIWIECKRCTRLHDGADPFPASGRCAHPNDHLLGPVHPYCVEDLLYDKTYRDALIADWALGSIWMRWVHGLEVTAADFLAIRERAVQGVEEDLAVGPSALLVEILGGHLPLLTHDFMSYYGLDAEQIGDAFARAVIFAVKTAMPPVLQGTIAQGADWQRHLLDVTRHHIWYHLRGGYLDTSCLDDGEFRALFEREWAELLKYQGDLYDFRVIPKLSFDDLVRYQKLPKGNAKIRVAISTYMSHQAKAYPFFAKAWVENVVELTLGRRIRLMYAALVESVADEAIKNLGARGPRTVEMRAAIIKQAWEIYDRSWQDFQFYWKDPRKRRPFGYHGTLAMASDPRAQKLFRQWVAENGLDYRDYDVLEIGFAIFIRQRLRRWVRATYPRDRSTLPTLSLDAPLFDEDDETLGDTLAGESGWDFDDTASLAEEPLCSAADGTRYFTIQQAVRRYRTTERRLRRLDEIGSYRALRAGKVKGLTPPMPRNTRLYPDTPESHQAIQVALDRAATHSSQLSGAEVNRKQAARFLGVPPSTLEHLERTGRLQPEKRGRSVVYSRALLEEARRLTARQR